MGRGDKKTKKNIVFRGSHGKIRPKKKQNAKKTTFSPPDLLRPEKGNPVHFF
ncbi:MAG: 30S ribosomal protein THX [Thermodesulfobacteriota bacterium]